MLLLTTILHCCHVADFVSISLTNRHQRGYNNVQLLIMDDSKSRHQLTPILIALRVNWTQQSTSRLHQVASASSANYRGKTETRVRPGLRSVYQNLLNFPNFVDMQRNKNGLVFLHYRTAPIKLNLKESSCETELYYFRDLSVFLGNRLHQIASAFRTISSPYAHFCARFLPSKFSCACPEKSSSSSSSSSKNICSAPITK